MKRIFIIKNGKEVVGASDYDGFVEHWVLKKRLECHRKGTRFMYLEQERLCSEYNKDDTLKALYQIVKWNGLYLEHDDFEYEETSDGRESTDSKSS